MASEFEVASISDVASECDVASESEVASEFEVASGSEVSSEFDVASVFEVADAAAAFKRRVDRRMKGCTSACHRRAMILSMIVEARTRSSRQRSLMHMSDSASTMFTAKATISSSPGLDKNVSSQCVVERGTLQLGTPSLIHTKTLVLRKKVTVRTSPALRTLLEAAEKGFPSSWVPLVLHFPEELFRELGAADEAERQLLVREQGEVAAATALQRVLGWHIECLTVDLEDQVQLVV